MPTSTKTVSEAEFISLLAQEAKQGETEARFWADNYRDVLFKQLMLNNAVAFVAAVLFAYVTNKLFVFESKSWSAKTLLREVPAFFGARLVSFGIEELLLLFSLSVVHAGSYILRLGGLSIGGVKVAKVLISVVTVILNYFFSKLFIFKKEEK